MLKKKKKDKKTYRNHDYHRKLNGGKVLHKLLWLQICFEFVVTTYEKQL